MNLRRVKRFTAVSLTAISIMGLLLALSCASSRVDASAMLQDACRKTATEDIPIESLVPGTETWEGTYKGHMVNTRFTVLKQWGGLGGGPRDRKETGYSDGGEEPVSELYMVNGWLYTRDRYDGTWSEWRIQPPDPVTSDIHSPGGGEGPVGNTGELNPDASSFCFEDGLNDLAFEGAARVNDVSTSRFSASADKEVWGLEQDDHRLMEFWVDEDGRLQQYKVDSYHADTNLSWKYTVTFSDFGRFHEITAPVPQPDNTAPVVP